MVSPKRRNQWTNGVCCSLCGSPVIPSQSVLAGRERTQGSVAFHRGCAISLVQGAWPECLYDEIREGILADPDKVLATL